MHGATMKMKKTGLLIWSSMSVRFLLKRTGHSNFNYKGLLCWARKLN